MVKDIICRKLRWAGHLTRMEEDSSSFKILTGKPKGKRPLGRPRLTTNHSNMARFSLIPSHKWT